MKHTLLILLASAALAAVLLEPRGDIWEEQVRRGLYRLRGDSLPSFATEFTDSSGIPYVFYSKENNIEPGYQYNATIVANYALQYHDQWKQGDSLSRIRFFRCVQWLEQHADTSGGMAIYRFFWQQPWYPEVKAPFTSGMTSGRVLEVLSRAMADSNRAAWAQLSKALIRGYFIPVQQGGFTYFSESGWWYEEIADTSLQTPRILDGHIFALMGAHAFWTLSGNDSAKMVYQKGLDALREALPRYDAGKGLMYYDAQQRLADNKYRKILTAQMRTCWALTSDSTFLRYYQSWNAPLARPWAVRMWRDGNRSAWILYLFSTAILFVSFRGLMFLIRRGKSGTPA